MQALNEKIERKQERSMILFCLRNFLQPKGGALKTALEEMSFSNLVWNFIIHVTMIHRILPFFSLALFENGQLRKIPPLFQGLLKENLNQGVMQNLVKMAEFEKVHEIFEKERIAILPLKGVALTHEIYSETPIRQMGDVDLLIREEDSGKAKKLLCERGFELKEGFNRWQTPLTDSLLGRSGYWRDGLDLDLQWRPRFVFGGNSIEWDAVGAWQRASPCPSLGENVFLLTPEDNARYLLFQICNDWEAKRLFWVQLLDLAAVLRKNQMDIGELSRISSKNLPVASAKKLELFECLLKECFFEEKDYGEFSWESREVIDYLFNHLPIVLDGFSGKSFLEGTSSISDKLIFLLGYLFPSRWLVRNQYGKGPAAFLRACLDHWKRLFLKFFQLVSGRPRL